MDETYTFIDKCKPNETKISIAQEMELDEISTKAENGRLNGLQRTSLDKVYRISSIILYSFFPCIQNCFYINFMF